MTPENAQPDRYPQWKVDLFRAGMAERRAPVCTCRSHDYTRSTCPAHGWIGDKDAEEGRSIIENDAIQGEHRRA